MTLTSAYTLVKARGVSTVITPAAVFAFLFEVLLVVLVILTIVAIFRKYRRPRGSAGQPLVFDVEAQVGTRDLEVRQASNLRNHRASSFSSSRRCAPCPGITDDSAASLLKDHPSPIYLHCPLYAQPNSPPAKEPLVDYTSFKARSIQELISEALTYHTPSTPGATRPHTAGHVEATQTRSPARHVKTAQELDYDVAPSAPPSLVSEPDSPPPTTPPVGMHWDVRIASDMHHHSLRHLASTWPALRDDSEVATDVPRNGLGLSQTGDLALRPRGARATAEIEDVPKTVAEILAASVLDPSPIHEFCLKGPAIRLLGHHMDEDPSGVALADWEASCLIGGSLVGAFAYGSGSSLGSGDSDPVGEENPECFIELQRVKTVYQADILYADKSIRPSSATFFGGLDSFGLPLSSSEFGSWARMGHSESSNSASTSSSCPCSMSICTE
ncbi:hypothetical protein NUW54_g6585 [Trametes sanguinea]|uniref:Uncharacterized protein n=1 Tax=Trametes sanguinea TaxID=158606 RepID=A0ACC1PV61_9APHY|nr:hypothetical protein NUW54_g6585 [Trametes sanguinea]